MSDNYLSVLTKLYTAEQVRAAEARAVSDGSISRYDLVKRAAHETFNLLQANQPESASILVLAGHGNNAADAYVTAAMLLKIGRNVSVQASAAQHPTMELQLAIEEFNQLGGRSTEFCLKQISEANVIVDGLLGTGLSGELSDELLTVINAINQSQAWVLSLDVPSGIDADTGRSHKGAVNANVTLVFGAIKQGLLTSEARHCCGQLQFEDIGISSFLGASKVSQLVSQDLPKVFMSRRADSHKGSHGKVTVIGGDFGMTGAVRLAAEGCLRAGAGLVTVISRPEHQALICGTRPELMFRGCELVDMEVYHKLGWANVLVIGPGLGVTDWGYNLLKAVDLAEKPSVIDADALNLLCQLSFSNPHWVLTPHPGEAARLLGVTVTEVEQDRFKAVQALHDKYGGVIVLKGAGTLIFDGVHCVVAPVGNPGLASGGCGDVLAGVIGALIAQGYSGMQAAYFGVLIHGDAADLAAQAGERGMLASDLMPYIRQLVNQI
ncbi:NAD(P)H-hydrate dehydratase [Shewanella youngdeokensis]|uniref:Bifunctional NAD(P)H-hydrate repair enzyme n=1 Tax=Shewanella youngdeokensis TaxID=2999068 RepID=A0ABZ0JYQ9_9GAMM|nr:NAD(P)H-hydrate dehydratase [Shewanella sp. DAU334]